MNQAIQVLDGCIYIETKKALQVDVMVAGQMLVCYISGKDKESLMSIYRAKQFEIEELIEQQGLQEKWNSDGEIWLTADAINVY
ncbi:hypothetical protein [uncultured Paraglaciecola sp.]|uniref:hypothetical protein n=1 Tax=uncultured Paraglaciecola sp. TaxID=1765024 RepID=UPI00261012B3|nr:hypothetical protein [uncultured Paraglaciecola sp.]